MIVSTDSSATSNHSLGIEAVANHAGGKIPPELRADYIHTVQARAAAAYPVEPMAAKILRMRSPVQRLRAELSPDGVQITNTAIGDARGGRHLGRGLGEHRLDRGRRRR